MHCLSRQRPPLTLSPTQLPPPSPPPTPLPSRRLPGLRLRPGPLPALGALWAFYFAYVPPLQPFSNVPLAPQGEAAELVCCTRPVRSRKSVAAGGVCGRQKCARRRRGRFAQSCKCRERYLLCERAHVRACVRVFVDVCARVRACVCVCVQWVLA
jgi:hypothetical protein